MYLNLAPFRYSHLLSQNNGPINKINVINGTDVRGRPCYEVQAFLNPKLKSSSIEGTEFYGICDATGTDRFLQIALWKAISESIERWSFHHLLKSGTTFYGMDTGKTSTGFAALPCWPKNQVKKIALSEAIERWSISNWWTHQINSELLPNRINNFNIQVVRLKIPEASGFVTILFGTEKAGDRDISYYGFAHGYSLERSIEKASVELIRNKRVLLLNPLKQPKSISDQRLLYFSTAEGLERFKCRINDEIRKPVAMPNLVVDTQISGEWDKYATVWRCLLPNTDYHWSDPTHFMF